MRGGFKNNVFLDVFGPYIAIGIPSNFGWEDLDPYDYSYPKQHNLLVLFNLIQQQNPSSRCFLAILIHFIVYIFELSNTFSSTIFYFPGDFIRFILQPLTTGPCHTRRRVKPFRLHRGGAFAREDGRLHRGAVGHRLVGVDGLVGLLTTRRGAPLRPGRPKAVVSKGKEPFNLSSKSWGSVVFFWKNMCELMFFSDGQTKMCQNHDSLICFVCKIMLARVIVIMISLKTYVTRVWTSRFKTWFFWHLLLWMLDWKCLKSYCSNLLKCLFNARFEWPCS